ncbi:MAG: DUF86 domain-containing protein [Firmicutes bacterium]|nr:DUF86 domain-containing protein [Bacillota bacterium]
MPYGELNLARIRQKVADIKEALVILQDYASWDDKAFLTNGEAIRSARYAFIVLIEAASNIANHLCAKLLAKAPTSYADAFILLSEKGILDKGLTRQLAAMTGFRNLLVHRYGEIDDRRMLDIMRKDLGDLDRYLSAVEKVIRSHNKGKEKGISG